MELDIHTTQPTHRVISLDTVGIVSLLLLVLTLDMKRRILSLCRKYTARIPNCACNEPEASDAARMNYVSTTNPPKVLEIPFEILILIASNFNEYDMKHFSMVTTVLLPYIDI
ncbi:hypothetical protein F4703DRAFT_1799456 [Phycomyces blakesleeanus]